MITQKANWAKYPELVFSRIVPLEQHWQRPLLKAWAASWNGIDRLRAGNLPRRNGEKGGVLHFTVALTKIIKGL